MRRLTFWIVLMLLPILLTAGVVVAHTMQDGMHEAGCPMMPAQQSVCLMDVFDHIAIVQHISAAVVPLLMLCLVAWVLRTVWRAIDFAVLLVRARSPSSQRVLAQPSLFEQLFADGILHPKAP